jgi:hypothetical protein
LKNKKNLQSYNISNDLLPMTILDMSIKVSSLRRYKIEENYSSVYDFYGILFYFRFIEKLESSEIANLLGVQVETIHIHFYNLRWHYSKDFEQNNVEYKKEIEFLTTVLNNAKKIAVENEIDQHPKVKEALLKAKGIKSSSYTKLNMNSLEEYIWVLYHLIYIEELTTVQLSILFNLSYSTIAFRVKKLGFNLTHAEGILKKSKNKRHNYEKTERARKVTIIKSQKEHSSTGSKNENYARFLLANFMYDYLDSKVFDIIVGVNNTGILFSNEVDIPLIVHNRLNNKIFKFAIEYNGEIYHENDNEKILKSKERGWIYLPIIELKNQRASNSPKIIENLVRNTCEIIKKHVENHN